VAAKPKLFIHMGTHRTATTSIQAFMFTNREAALGAGVLYPFGVSRHNIQIRSVATGASTTKELADQILAEISAVGQPVHTVVISDEDVSFIDDLSVFAKLKDSFDLHFILFMRRQDLWLESWYMQNVKWQFNKKYCHMTFDDFYASRGDFFWIDYAEVIRGLERFVAPENIHLSVFETAQQSDGPVAAFCKIIALADDSSYQPAPHRNSSMSPLMTEFVRHLPLIKAKPPFRSFLERACGRVDQMMTKQKGSSLYIPHSERIRFMEKFEKGNKLIAKKYFEREQLFLEPLPSANAPMANKDLPTSVEELMTQFVGPMIGEMIAERNAQDRKAVVGKS
jgi:hypothetical protein